MMKGKSSPAVIAGIVVGLLVYGAAGYFLLISPQRSKAAELKKETQATVQQVEQYRALAAQARNTPPIRVAELFRLTKAMPDDVDMAGLVLELSRVARESGIEFDAISPKGPAAATGYSSIEIALEFDGNYYELSDFLFRLRNLVRVRSGRLDAQGRLFLVNSISFNESAKSFPRIKATLVVHAFSYGDVTSTQPAVAPPPATTTPAETTTTPEGTPATPTETPPVASGSSAAGAVP